MARTQRNFFASFGVNFGTHMRFEVAHAEEWGGPEGLVRIRMDRRWVDAEDGQPRFFDRAALAGFIAAHALGEVEEVKPEPVLPVDTRVTATVWEDGTPHSFGTWTLTPPILNRSGEWMVAVSVNGKHVFVPCDDVTPREKR